MSEGNYQSYSDASDDAVRDVAKVYLPTRRACWLCSRQLQRMQSGPHKGLYAAVMWEDDEGFNRYAHEQCWNTRNVLDYEAEWQDETDESEALP
jgi:hypothetical protein